ncbi:MAG: ATP-binding cassette domain-containing protein [Clostridiales bacterium]|jgi:ABC-type sugar transport system ATPase subunit|nr:ATP-binding cassette domain-containing protein [Clostridiales bacterium]
MNVIELKNVKKKYLYGAEALNGVSFALGKGEKLTVFGGAGAGKTALLKAIAGLTEFEGEMRLFGKPCAGLPLRDRNISMTFSDAFKKSKTVYENLRFSFDLRNIERSAFEEKLREIDGAFGIGYLYFFKFADLNAGQRASVTAARCLMRDADLYLLDNPLKGLDADEKRGFILRFLAYLKDKDYTVIYATDDLAETRLLNFKNLTLNCGFTGGCGYLEDLYAAPPELSLCRLFGMNVFDEGDVYAAVKPRDLEIAGYSGASEKGVCLTVKRRDSEAETLNDISGGGVCAAVKPQDLRTIKPADGNVRDRKKSFAEAFFIGEEFCSDGGKAEYFVSAAEPRIFFSLSRERSEKRPLPMSAGDAVTLCYSPDKALRYGKSDEKLKK